MTKQEILKRAILKAEANGLPISPYFSCGTGLSPIERSFPDCYYHAASIIFSHDFAKAFWGRSKTDAVSFDKYFHAVVDITGEEAFLGYSGELWQYCLQQMVLEEDPIKYLEKFL